MSSHKLLRKLFKQEVRNDADNTNEAAFLRKPQPSSSPNTAPAQQLHQRQTTTPAEPAPTTSENHLGFLSLPGEVRNLIYAKITYPSLSSISIHQKSAPIFSHTIFRICRQLRFEAISYLCATKTIHLASISVANNFFATIGECGMASLRRIEVMYRDAGRADGTASPWAMVRNGKFLKHIEGMRNLQWLAVLVKEESWARDERGQLEGAHVGDVRFFRAVRNVVDGTGGEEEKVLDGEMIRVVDAVGAGGAIDYVRAGKDGERLGKVFQLLEMNFCFPCIRIELKIPSLAPPSLQTGEDVLTHDN